MIRPVGLSPRQPVAVAVADDGVSRGRCQCVENMKCAIEDLDLSFGEACPYGNVRCCSQRSEVKLREKEPRFFTFYNNWLTKDTKDTADEKEPGFENRIDQGCVEKDVLREGSDGTWEVVKTTCSNTEPEWSLWCLWWCGSSS